MSPTVVPASFRDPSNFVWTDSGSVYRHIGESYREHYDLLLSSGLYDDLVSTIRLVPHTEVTDVASPRPRAYRVLKPEVVPFISYPYEWSFSQLKDAALLTLDIQKRAMEHGMSLRDASAYNVQFREGRPLFIDTSSFEILREGRPWIAYRQFCQHFLAPLALMAHRDVRFGALSRLHIDGVPLDLASKSLPARTRYSVGLVSHIHAQARLERRHQDRGARGAETVRLSTQRLKSLVWSLERTVRGLDWDPSGSYWSNYYRDADHYSEQSLEHKKQLVATFVEKAGGQTVWDLGGNVGVFSREAAARGRDVVCIDLDPSCVEMNYRRVKEDGERHILPLLCDLRNPTPGVGWANRERSSLLERAPADVVMALALLHHLAIGNSVPLRMIAEFLAGLGKSLIIEFPPKTDQMVEVLLRGRDDIFLDYDVRAFESAFESHFVIDERETVRGTDRVMYLMHTPA